jgi:hypothetical protein
MDASGGLKVVGMTVGIGGRVARRVTLLIMSLVSMSVMLACSSTTDGTTSPNDEPSPESVWADQVPKGIKVVDSGYRSLGTGSEGEPIIALGVILENTTDKPMVLRVEFAVWDTDNDAELSSKPWWEGPEEGRWPIFLAIGPNKKSGTGDTFKGRVEDKSKVPAHIKVKASHYGEDEYQGSPVGFSAQAAAEPDKSMKATVTKVTDSPDIEFTVDNPYEKDVVEVGVGIVLRHENGEVSGGWSYHPKEASGLDGSKFVPAEFPPGKSVHKITLPQLASGWTLDESTLQIYVWARG